MLEADSPPAVHDQARKLGNMQHTNFVGLNATQPDTAMKRHSPNGIHKAEGKSSTSDYETAPSEVSAPDSDVSEGTRCSRAAEAGPHSGTAPQAGQQAAAESPASHPVSLSEVAAGLVAAPRPVVLSLEELPDPHSKGLSLADSELPELADPAARSAAAESTSKDSTDSARERSSFGSMLCHEAAEPSALTEALASAPPATGVSGGPHTSSQAGTPDEGRPNDAEHGSSLAESAQAPLDPPEGAASPGGRDAEAMPASSAPAPSGQQGKDIPGRSQPPSSPAHGLHGRRSSADLRGHRPSGRRPGSFDEGRFSRLPVMPPYAMPLTPVQMGSLGSMPGMMLPGSPGHGMMPMYPNPFGYYQPMPYHPMQFYPYDPSAMPLGGQMGLEAKLNGVNRMFAEGMMHQGPPLWAPLAEQHPHPHHQTQQPPQQQGDAARLPRSNSRGSLGTRSGSGSMQRQSSSQADAPFPRQNSFGRQTSFEGGPHIPRQASNISELSRQPSSSSIPDGPHRHRRQSSFPSLEMEGAGAMPQAQGAHRPPPKGHRRSQSFTLEGSRSLPRLSRDRPLLDARSIMGRVVGMSRDQGGSRTVQQAIEAASHTGTQQATQILEELQPHALALMTDQFGNYVIQKLLDHGGEDVRAALGKEIQGRVLELTVNTFGCRIVQKALEVLEQGEKLRLAQELQGYVLACVASQHGNHVIQKCIEAVQPSEAVAFVTEELLHGGGQPLPLELARARSVGERVDVPAEAGVLPLSKHTYGCRVVQRLLEYCTLQHVRKEVLAAILANAVTLASNTMGNYVIQHVIQHGAATALPQSSRQEAKAEADQDGDFRHQVIMALLPHIIPMSCNKFGSNVVEGCLSNSTPEERVNIVNSFLDSFEADDGDTLLTLLKDQYGNYVAQQLLEWATDDQLEAIRVRIASQEAALKKATYAKHFLNALHQRDAPSGSQGQAHTAEASQESSGVDAAVAAAVAAAVRPLEAPRAEAA